MSSLLITLTLFVDCNRAQLSSHTCQDVQSPLALNHYLKADMTIFFASALDPTGSHLILPNSNSLQYNLDSTNPAYLYVSILVSYP